MSAERGARSVAADEAQACDKSVHWWDGEYEGTCDLPVGHEGPHFDGLSWYDDAGDEVESNPLRKR